MARTLPKVGDKKTFKPYAFTEGEVPSGVHAVTGRVIYVHPKGQYYTVEAELYGEKIRECFFPDR